MAQSDNVYDVAPGAFESDVLEASAERPVVVDFWAEWCAPCRALGPVLEEVVESYGDRAALARVNVDEHRQVAARYGVQGIPAVKVFRDGAVVGEFVGALPRPEVERALARVLPTRADELVREGHQLLGSGDTDAARERFESALEEEPGHAAALLGLGRIALESGETELARELLGRIGEDASEHAPARALLAGVEFAETCREHGGAEACRERLESAPDDLDARYALGCCLAAREDYEEALEAFIEVLSRDRKYRDDAARQAVLDVFELIGPRSELAGRYRRKLAAVLY
ncbi:MAG: tetratricopeptide repeat protein [Candidatus Brocadiia bacterium]